MNQFVKQAYVQGLAARAILRARIMQKQAGGVKDYALAGGVGAGGGALIGALINYARKKSLLQGALAGAGVGGVAGLGYQGVKDLLSKDSREGYRVNRTPQEELELITSKDSDRRRVASQASPVSDYMLGSDTHSSADTQGTNPDSGMLPGAISTPVDNTDTSDEFYWDESGTKILGRRDIPKADQGLRGVKTYNSNRQRI